MLVPGILGLFLRGRRLFTSGVLDIVSDKASNKDDFPLLLRPPMTVIGAN